jgi:hypothetical protein
MHQVERYAPKPHFRAGFCPKILLEQPESPTNHTISQSNMQVIGQRDWFLQFQIQGHTPFPVVKTWRHKEV